MLFRSNKSTLEIFRDCLKAAPFMNSNPATVAASRSMIKEQFRRHMSEQDQKKIDELRFT